MIPFKMDELKRSLPRCRHQNRHWDTLLPFAVAFAVAFALIAFSFFTPPAICHFLTSALNLPFAPLQHPLTHSPTTATMRMPPPYRPPSGTASSTVAASEQDHDCEYRSTRSPVALDANLLSLVVRIITLTSPDCNRRHIVLHPDEPVTIGRSSRSDVEKPSSSTGNALFDCPVVSREHAEFEVRLNTIYITDTGSKHGTFVNSQKLQPSKGFHLRLGDTISLGSGQSEHPFTEMRRVTSHADSIPDSYNGVTVTLACVSVASERLQSQIFSSSEDDSPIARTARWCALLRGQHHQHLSHADSGRKKRKASEISTSSVSMTTAPEVQPPDQPPTKKSKLCTAAIEATKYTAGAVVGGAVTITVLASW
jgi:hypothetical protein